MQPNRTKPLTEKLTVASNGDMQYELSLDICTHKALPQSCKGALSKQSQDRGGSTDGWRLSLFVFTLAFLFLHYLGLSSPLALRC